MFLNVKNSASLIYPLFIVFANQKISTMMHDLKKLFNDFRTINNGKRGGDKIKIESIENGSFRSESKDKINQLITLLSQNTNWEYKKDSWTLDNLNVIDMQKNIEQKLNGTIYERIINNNPFSLAITGEGGKRMEYTLER